MGGDPQKWTSRYRYWDSNVPHIDSGEITRQVITIYTDLVSLWYYILLMYIWHVLHTFLLLCDWLCYISTIKMDTCNICVCFTTPASRSERGIFQLQYPSLRHCCHLIIPSCTNRQMAAPKSGWVPDRFLLCVQTITIFWTESSHDATPRFQQSGH